MSNISPSLEDYLEAIFSLSQTDSKIHMSDIAIMLNVSKASVNRAMGALQEKGFISQERYRPIQLTEKGSERAAEVAKIHSLMRDFLLNVLNVSPKTAESDACKMEHTVSEETVNKLIIFMDKYKKCTTIDK